MADDLKTETLDKLYLEWSQFTKAKTHRELKLEEQIRIIADSKSWVDQAAFSEIALAEIEDRAPDQFAIDWLHNQ